MKQKGNTTQVSFRSFSGLINVSKSLSEMAFLFEHNPHHRSIFLFTLMFESAFSI